MKRLARARVFQSQCRLRHPYRQNPYANADIQRRDDSTTPPRRTFPGFLPDTLDVPLHSIVTQSRTSSNQPPPDEQLKTEEESKIARARLVFGSRLAGPVEREKAKESASQNIAGVLVPPKPEEPDNCCMSGCANCVWDLFRDDIEEWAAKSAEARAKLTKQREAKGKALDNWDEVESEREMEGRLGVHHGETDPFEGIPIGIREFMKTEKKLKQRHRLEKLTGV